MPMIIVETSNVISQIRLCQNGDMPATVFMISSPG